MARSPGAGAGTPSPPRRRHPRPGRRPGDIMGAPNGSLRGRGTPLRLGFLRAARNIFSGQFQRVREPMGSFPDI